MPSTNYPSACPGRSVLTSYELTQNENSILWVAEALPDQPGVQPRITGMIVVWLVVDEAHVATLAVHPDFRGQGLSKKLLALGLRSCHPARGD